MMKFRPLVWRSSHPHLLADRLEDVTDPELLRNNPKCDRDVSVYGYLRGTLLKKNQHVHIAGVGDFPIGDMAFLPDPCPLPDGIKKRTLVEKDKSIYAPMSGVGGIVYDKDAVYIELGGSHSHKKEQEESSGLVENIIATETTLNEKLEKSELRLLTGSVPMSSVEHREVLEAEGRRRRKAVFKDGKEDVDLSDYGGSEDEKEGGEEEGDSDIEDDSEDEEDESGSDEDAKESEDEAQTKPAVVKTSKRRSDDEELPKKGVKKMKVSSINDQLMREIGEDMDGESESESEGEDEQVSSEVKPIKIKSSQLKNKSLVDTNIFHPRLTTKADKSAHSKVAEALSKISEKDTAAVEDDDDSDDDEDSDGSEAGDDSDEESVGSEGEVEDSVPQETVQRPVDEDDEMIALHWKADLAMKARDSFYARQSGTASLRRLVYGQEEAAETGEDEAETVGGLFKLKTGGGPRRQELNGRDCSVWGVEHHQDWQRDEIMDRIRDCFVTGTWAKGRDAEELMKLDDEEDEVYGDFEDLETGKSVSGKEGEEEDDEEEEKPNVVNYGGDREKELAKRKERMERKLKLKRSFDQDYDGGEGGEKSSYYDDLKKEVDDQSQLNRGEFEGMDDSLRVQYEGFRPGMYVRLEVAGVPCELLQHHDPVFPLLLGGLLKGEDQLGYVQIRVKKHRWYPKILKNRDPLIVSLGMFCK